MNPKATQAFGGLTQEELEETAGNKPGGKEWR